MALAFAAVGAPTIASLGVALGAWFANRERAFQVLLATSLPFLFKQAARTDVHHTVVSNWQAERGDPEFGLVVAMSGGESYRASTMAL